MQVHSGRAAPETLTGGTREGDRPGAQDLVPGLSLRFALAAIYADEAKAREIEKDVYQAGLALMLLAGVPGHEPAAAQRARRRRARIALAAASAAWRWPGAASVAPGYWVGTGAAGRS